jgi:hypothetical protein
MTPEGTIKALIDTVLKDRDDTWFFKPVQSGYGKRTLDYIGCTCGHFWAIEAKRDGKEPTTFQRITISNMLLAGAMVFKISSKEGVDAFVKWLGKVEANRFLQTTKI